MATLIRPDKPSDLFRQIREDLGGISQAEFARRIGIEQPSVNRIERGKQPLTAATAVKLIQRLGIDAELVLPLVDLRGYHDLHLFDPAYVE